MTLTEPTVSKSTINHITEGGTGHAPTPHSAPNRNANILNVTEEMTTLTTGVYEIPPDCKAIIRGGKVYISPRKRCEDRTPRCRECKHFARGFSKYNQRYPSPVCLMRPKTNGLINGSGYDRVSEQKRYYSTLACRKVCDKYQPNN